VAQSGLQRGGPDSDSLPGLWEGGHAGPAQRSWSLRQHWRCHCIWDTPAGWGCVWGRPISVGPTVSCGITWTMEGSWNTLPVACQMSNITLSGINWFGFGKITNHEENMKYITFIDCFVFVAIFLYDLNCLQIFYTSLGTHRENI